MARSWTTQEVLEGWVRHYEAMLDGKLKPVRLPSGKQPSYHKGAGPSIDLDFGAWTRVEGLGVRDVQIRQALRDGSGHVWDALSADLARCPYPCEAPEKEPPMPESKGRDVINAARKAWIVTASARSGAALAKAKYRKGKIEPN
jgi:hypothetical protein